MSASLNQLIPELQPFARDLIAAAGAAGLLPRVTSTVRTYSEQGRLYRRFLAGLSPYPAAPPGHSAHEYGYAFDMIVSPLSALSDCGDYWEKLGGVWGGRYGDDVHFEYPGFKQDYGGAIDEAQAADDATGGGSPNILVRAAETLANLPWYSSIFLPFALATEQLDPNDPRVVGFKHRRSPPGY